MAKKADIIFNDDGKEFLTVKVEGRGTFEVPLPSSLPLKTMRELWALQRDDDSGEKALDWSIAFFEKYIGDAMDDFTLGDFVKLQTAWQDAGDVGESSASSD